MQPILALAVAGVAVAALGVGFLENDIDLTNMVQQFGVGEATIDTPITSAYIDFVIDRTTYTKNVNGETKTIMRNIISECVVQGNNTIFKDSTVICKLTDAMSNVVAEGRKLVAYDLAPLALITVPVTIFASGTPMDSDVTNIHDVILVVQGPSALVPQAP